MACVGSAPRRGAAPQPTHENDHPGRAPRHHNARSGDPTRGLSHSHPVAHDHASSLSAVAGRARTGGSHHKDYQCR
eukprot:1306666-Amphidinium_carterae.1